MGVYLTLKDRSINKQKLGGGHVSITRRNTEKKTSFDDPKNTPTIW